MTDHPRSERPPAASRRRQGGPLRPERSASLAWSLRAATEALSGALGDDEVATALIREGGEELGASAGALLRLSDDGRSVELRHAVGLAEDVIAALRTTPLHGDPTPVRDVLRTGEARFFVSRADCVASYPNTAGFLEALDTRAMAYLPLSVERRCVGVLALCFPADRSFPDEARELLGTLARLGGQALERVHLLHETSQAQQRADASDRRLLAQVAETRRATRALRESEDQFRTLADSIPQLAWMADATGSIFWYNRRWFEYTGTTLQAMEGWGWKAVHHPGHVERVTARYREHIEAGQPWEDTFPLRSASGEYRWFLSRALPILDPDGRVTRWFGTNTDVTDQLRSSAERDALLARERSAREEAQRARVSAQRVADRLLRLQRVTAALSAAPTPERIAAVVVEEGASAVGADSGMLLRVVNEGSSLEVAASHGLAGEEAEAWRDLPATADDPVGEVVRTGAPLFVSTAEERSRRFAREDLRKRTGTDAVAVLPLLHHGEMLGALKLGFRGRREFSPEERAFLETLALQAAQALDRAHLFEGEHRAREAAEQANRAKAQFLGVMSHELRTPLNAVLGYADLLLAEIRGELNAAQRRQVERIQVSARAQLGLIEEILSFARIEAGREEVHPCGVDVSAMLHEVADMLRPEAERSGLLLRVVTDGDVTLTTDAAKLRQIVLNLAGNACKFTDEGEVALEASGVEDHVVVRVRDTGPGIPEDKREAVFEPFTQVDQSATRAGLGTGLGLSISRRLATLLGGTVELEPGEPRGCTFVLRVPRSLPESA